MIEIYGASDDLIEVEGDIRAEFYAKEDAASALAFSDGTILLIEYTSGGMWRINRAQAGTAQFEKVEATDPDGEYSDRVTLSGDIGWVVCGEMARCKPTTRPA